MYKCLSCMIIIWLVIGGGIGCSNTSSGRSTDDIQASYVVSTNETGDSHLKVVLRLYGLQKLELSSNDSLIAKVAEERRPVPMVKSGQYELALGRLSAGTEVRLDLVRESEKSALNSTVVIPPPFEVEALEQDRYSGGLILQGAIELSWTSSGLGFMGVDVDGDCIVPWSRLVPDRGQYLLDPISYNGSRAEGALESCEVKIKMTRSLPGIIADEFDILSGARAEQVRLLSFIYDP